MPSTITNLPQGLKDKRGKNLGILLSYAGSAGGVKAITVHKLQDAWQPEAFLEIKYANGAVGKTYFMDAEHALDWANRRSNGNPRVSWWAGCKVRQEVHEKGSWNYAQSRPTDPILDFGWPVTGEGTHHGKTV